LETNNFRLNIGVVMKKRFIILAVILLFLVGCSQVEEKVVEQPEVIEEVSKEKSEFQRPGDYAGLDNNLDILIEDKNVIGPDHYQRLKSNIDDLEERGEDVTVLREKLAEIPVAKDLKTKPEEMPIEKPIDVPKEENKLPACTGTEKYTHEPVDLDIVAEISPLGSLNPPGHTIPTEHTYLHIGEYDSIEIYPLYSPGKIYVTGIAEDKDDIAPDRKEYNIQFGLCSDLKGYFNHVKELRGILKEEFDKSECEQWTENPAEICQKNMFVSLEPGEEIAGVGHKQGNFDIGAMDYTIELNFVNPSQYGPVDPETLHKVCPYDYYTPELKEKFYALIKSVSEPKCGVVMQDVPGTLAGNWFAVDQAWLSSSDWDKQLTFGHDNYDHSIPMISIGGWFTEASKWQIVPQSSGLTNRRFEEVTPDGNIYCYSGTNPYASTMGSALSTEEHTGKIIVQMVNATQLQIEKQEGNCGSSEKFGEPFVYNR